MRHYFFAALGLAALALAGCGAKGTVSGQVKFNGRPLPWGQITFLSEAGDKPVLHAPVRDGSYTVPEVPVGSARVTVTTTPPPAPIKLPPGVKPVQASEGTNTDATPGRQVRAAAPPVQPTRPVGRAVHGQGRPAGF